MTSNTFNWHKNRLNRCFAFSPTNYYQFHIRILLTDFCATSVEKFQSAEHSIFFLCGKICDSSKEIREPSSLTKSRKTSKGNSKSSKYCFICASKRQQFFINKFPRSNIPRKEIERSKWTSWKISGESKTVIKLNIGHKIISVALLCLNYCIGKAWKCIT